MPQLWSKKRGVDSKMIILVTGDFGVGKDTFADYLLEAFQGKAQKILSYTTRAPRYADENTHIFVEEMAKGEIVACSQIDGQYYWTLPEQFDKNKINIYVVDDIGVRDTIASGIDKTLIIKITRPTHLIDLDKERLTRKRTEFFEFEPDLEIINDGTLQDLQFAANNIPTILPLYHKF